jgi:hypothetical protein
MTHTALTALACLLLCTSAVASTSALSPAGPARASSHASAQKPGTWLQAPMKKGGSGVSVRWHMAATPKVGEPVTLTIELGGLRSPEGARVEVKGENINLARVTGMQALKAGPPQQQQVSFTPTAEGVYFISVFTEQAGRVSAVSLPVQVGKAGVKLEKPGQTTTLPNGERAVIMPSS